MEERPRLNLKPRDEQAAKLMEQQRQNSGNNPFGDAKPREAVLAAKTGKREEEILVEEASKTKIHFRLTPEQHEQRKAAVAVIRDAKQQLATGEGDEALLQKQVDAAQAAYDQMIAEFERLNTEAALKGETSRPSERRAQHVAQQHEGATQQQGPPRTGYHPTRPQHHQPPSTNAGYNQGGYNQGGYNQGGHSNGPGEKYHPTRPQQGNGYNNGGHAGRSYGRGNSGWNREGGISPAGSYDSGHDDGFSNFKRQGGRGGPPGYGGPQRGPPQGQGGDFMQRGRYQDQNGQWNPRGPREDYNGSYGSYGSDKGQSGGNGNGNYRGRPKDGNRGHYDGGYLANGVESYRSSYDGNTAYLDPNSAPDERY